MNKTLEKMKLTSYQFYPQMTESISLENSGFDKGKHILSNLRLHFNFYIATTAKNLKFPIYLHLFAIKFNNNKISDQNKFIEDY